MDYVVFNSFFFLAPPKRKLFLLNLNELYVPLRQELNLFLIISIN